MRTTSASVVCAIGVLGASVVIGSTAPNDAHFLDLLPADAALTRADQTQLERGEPMARVIDAPDGQIAVLAMVGTAASADRLASSVRDIATLKRGTYVPAIRRFSSPPTLGDLEGLRVSPEDRRDIKDCTADECGIKLTADEIAALPRADGASAGAPGEPDALDHAFRAIVLSRVQRYLREGRATEATSAPARVPPPFERILSTSPYVTLAFPRLSDYLRRFPAQVDHDIESFLYWSVETFGRKPVVVVTHVAMLRPSLEEASRGVELLVAGKQVFATHYINASLSLTALVEFRGHRYLTYVNRSETDALGGWLGWLKRAVVERRVRNEAATILNGVRTRLESRSRRD